MLFSNFAILLWSWMQLFRMRRTGDTEWDIEGLLPVSFAPLINCKEDKKEFPQFIEIRKCTTWNPNLNHLHQLLNFTMDLTLYILMFAFYILFTVVSVVFTLPIILADHQKLLNQWSFLFSLNGYIWFKGD